MAFSFGRPIVDRTLWTIPGGFLPPDPKVGTRPQRSLDDQLLVVVTSTPLVPSAKPPWITPGRFGAPNNQSVDVGPLSPSLALVVDPTILVSELVAQIVARSRSSNPAMRTFTITRLHMNVGLHSGPMAFGGNQSRPTVAQLPELPPQISVAEIVGCMSRAATFAGSNFQVVPEWVPITARA